MRLKVGTRGSRLALLQTEIVIKNLKTINPKLEFEIKVIETLGDRIKHKPPFVIEGKGIFEREIDQALLKGEIDIAVHSLKDVPVYEQQENSDIIIAAVPKRGDPREALVSIDGSTFHELPKGALIGTSSLRRMAQVKFLRKDLNIKPIRGNLDTRIRMVKQGRCHAIIVAKVGLERMGLEDLASEILPLDFFTPAPGQGALAVTARKDETKLLELLESINHPPSLAEVTAERSLVAELKGGCHFPVGAIARVRGEKLTLYGCIFSVNGRKKLAASASGSIKEAKRVGRIVAHKLLRQGAMEIANEWRRRYELW